MIKGELMSPLEPEDPAFIKNKKIVENLREKFRPLERRLTPDVEPATVFTVSTPVEDTAE
jgi:hypothetical protein